jgi:ABC-2 type transport system ATP-binding protein
MDSVSPIEIDNLSFDFPPRRVLDGVSFAVPPHTMCGLLGPNGSGKTTLFRLLATLLPAPPGAARVFGLDVAERPRDVRRCIGVAFQSPALDCRLTVEENLRHHGHLHGLSGRDLSRRIARELERADLHERAREPVGRLSGGQQRRVELAKCLLPAPRVLLLDEPGTGLDPAARLAFRQRLRRLCDGDGVTVLLTTHHLDDADACDRIVILDRGRVVDAGAPDALRAQIAADCVVVRGRDLPALAARIEEQLGVTAAACDGGLRIEHDRGHELVARLMERFGDRIESVTLSRATLEDVFLRRTGHRLTSDDPQGDMP